MSASVVGDAQSWLGFSSAHMISSLMPEIVRIRQSDSEQQKYVLRVWLPLVESLT